MTRYAPCEVTWSHTGGRLSPSYCCGPSLFLSGTFGKENPATSESAGLSLRQAGSGKPGHRGRRRLQNLATHKKFHTPQKDRATRQISVKNPAKIEIGGGHMLNNSDEQVWQFNVSSGEQMRDSGIHCFQTRARELAATIGCNLMGVKNVHLEFVRGSWKVTGTALLGKSKAAG